MRNGEATDAFIFDSTWTKLCEFTRLDGGRFRYAPHPAIGEEQAEAVAQHGSPNILMPV